MQGYYIVQRSGRIFTELVCKEEETACGMGQVYIHGVVTYPSHSTQSCARVCISKGRSADETRHDKSVCALGMNTTRFKACEDSCNCACKAALAIPITQNIFKWIASITSSGECRKMCLSACRQPERVRKSEFSGRL